MINNNNNKEGQMTHRLITQTFTFLDKVYKKGVDTYTKEDAFTILKNSKTIMLSWVDNGKIITKPFTDRDAYYHCGESARILVNKCGNKLYSIIYLSYSLGAE